MHRRQQTIGCFSRGFAVLLLAGLWSLSARAAGPAPVPHWFGQVEVYASLFGGIGDRSMEGTAFGGSLKAGYRWRSWGVFLSVENNAWVTPSTGASPTAAAQPAKVQPGAFNIGIGGELIYAHRYLRSALAIGPSILLYEDGSDPAGTTGIYVDLRPVGIRWPIKKWLVLMLDPVAFSLVAPVLTSIPLALFQFRSAFTTEFRW